jgi:hypothetical protein
MSTRDGDVGQASTLSVTPKTSVKLVQGVAGFCGWTHTCNFGQTSAGWKVCVNVVHWYTTEGKLIELTIKHMAGSNDGQDDSGWWDRAKLCDNNGNWVCL